ncbi:hypothetical protein NEMBOFW57_009193 [Staphylotrichum longicolle]|uniref:Uncharacterized protein n=1 Tax=Staphylotrichum longicolle TaxID=669026 RepID=A0AAD4HY01_9PEZI|nr:hypothetical protein NEMBOFW57_009193 [Staphylotrichum longicolle]
MQAQSATHSRVWRLRAAWPRPLDHLRDPDTAALETAALVIRMVSSYLEDPDALLSEAENPLVRFALRHDGLTPPLSQSEQLKLLNDVCAGAGLEGNSPSFHALMASYLMRPLWDMPELAFFDVCRRVNQGWARPVVEGPGELSQITWDGTLDLTSTLAARFGMLRPAGDIWVGAKMPAVFRVILTPVVPLTYDRICSTVVVGPHIDLAADGRMHIARREVHYVLIGVVRHRERQDPELARFYGETGLYISPTMARKDGVGRTYISDNWRVGEQGTYTLLYAQGCIPYECDREFVSATIADDGEESLAAMNLCTPLQGPVCGALNVDEERKRQAAESDAIPGLGDLGQFDQLGVSAGLQQALTEQFRGEN